jgi:protein involved in polysaccharide export with SLBB domain
MRETPALTLIDTLLDERVSIRAHDPAAMQQARNLLGDRIEYADSSYDALIGAEALTVVTDWNEYRHPDFERIKRTLRQPVIVDGRNLYNPARMRDMGIRYYSYWSAYRTRGRLDSSPAQLERKLPCSHVLVRGRITKVKNWMIAKPIWRFLPRAVTLLTAVAAVSRAQTAPTGVLRYETRAQLEEEARAATQAGRTTEATLIQYRLQHGDFREGDRVLVTVRSPGGFSDTLTVRAAKQLELPQLPPVSLEGILRSELAARLTTYLSQYLRDPVVIVRPLLRVGILGGVTRPGYYYASADLPLSDVLMTAGGPSNDADVSKLTVRRGNQIIIPEREGRAALSAGRTMDNLHMQAGDELQVGRQRQFTWPIVVSSITAVLGLLVALR